MGDGVAAALTAAAARLAGVSDSARLDAEVLMAHALGVERLTLLLSPGSYAVPDGFAELIERRARHEPVAYITGQAEFWSLPLAVGPGALVPRGDSETLIEASIAHFGAASPAHILDLGTGPGSLLLAALSHWPDAVGLGMDASPVALDYARRNAAALGMAQRCRLAHGDWTAAGWADALAGPFDLILCNPPYIVDAVRLMPDVAAYEPHAALFAGPDGLDTYRCILPAVPALLAAGGVAVLECGFDQREALTALVAALNSTGLGLDAAWRCDLAGRDRAMLLTHAAPMV